MNSVSIRGAFYALLKRDLLLAVRRRNDVFIPLLFFILVVTLVPLGIGTDKTLLQSVAPGIIWIAAVLAAMLSLDGLFRSDMEDGSLEQLWSTDCPFTLLILAKVIAHWLVTGLPLILVAPLLALLLGVENEGMAILLLTMLLGTPVLSLVGAIMVGITTGLRRGGLLLSLLVLPLYVPILIFATNAVSAATQGLPVNGQLAMLVAILILAVTLAPPAAAAALRMSLE